MGLAEYFLGSGNPFAQWANSNRRTLGGIGAGLASGTNFGEGLGLAARGAAAGREADDAYATQQKAEAQRVAEINQTAEWLKNNYPQFADLPPAQGFQLAAQLAGQKQQGSDAPANVREWEYFNGLAPKDQSAYLRMKRANPYLDIGLGFVQPDPINPGTTAGAPIIKEVRQEAAEQAGGTVEGRNAAEMAIQAPVQQANMARLDAQTDNVIQAVDKALGQAAWDSTGLIGQVMGSFAGTKAFDLRETAKTIKANLGFAELQAMRDASPTGGALGQVAVQELEALQSTLASLNADQSEQQLRENLALVAQLLERQKMYRRQAAEAKFGTPSQPAGGGGNVTSTGVPWSVEP